MNLTLAIAYVRAFYDSIGPEVDVPAPDLNTNPQTMSWMIDEYIKIYKEKNADKQYTDSQLRGAFTGKTIEDGGTYGRTEATERGGVFILREYLTKIGKKPEDTTVAVQGFGNVGYQLRPFCG